MRVGFSYQIARRIRDHDNINNDNILISYDAANWHEVSIWGGIDILPGWSCGLRIRFHVRSKYSVYLGLVYNPDVVVSPGVNNCNL